MASSSSSSSRSSYDYDVFLSFRGEDTRKTFVDYLYSTLEDRLIHTYKDDITLARGESITPALKRAIEGSRIAIVIFSENYADSSWCLEELAHIMKCKVERKLDVIPVFHCVEPSDVRKQKGKFGQAFRKHEAGNTDKVESWRKALVDASEIAGWETKNIAHGHEMEAIKKIADIVFEKLSYSTPDFDNDLVGMRFRLQELEALLEIGSCGVRMVGIWGIGGSGKTTIASSLHMKISQRFQSHCIVNDIGTEKLKNPGLTKLQEKLISGLLKKDIGLQSVAHGKQIIRTRLSHRNVLIILDDVDDIDQLDALVGSHDWFGPGSRIIITTRNEQLLISHKVEHIRQATLLSREEATQLFSKRAYNKNMCVKDYEELSKSVVSYCAGLPLALKILGSFLCGKDDKEWRCTLDRLKKIPEEKIVEKLRISYDGLKASEKQLFLDIACFFRKKNKRNAIELFEACGYDPGIGITVLKQKGLITEVDDPFLGFSYFDMHDLVQEMGRYIVKGDYPNDPGKHTRVWEDKNLMLLEGARENNDDTEAIHVAHNYSSRGVCKIISNMKKLRSLVVFPSDFSRSTCDDDWEGLNFLSNELRFIDWTNYPQSVFPDSFQPRKLSILLLSYSSQKELWKGYKYLPHLKVLRLHSLYNLLGTPDFEGLPCLQTLELHDCSALQEIHPSVGKHKSLEYISLYNCLMFRMFPTIISMGNLKTIEILNCSQFIENRLFSLEFPEIKTNMVSLVALSLEDVNIDVLLSSSLDRCANLISLHLVHCCFPKSKEVIFDGSKHQKDLRSPLAKLGRKVWGGEKSRILIPGGRSLIPVSTKLRHWRSQGLINGMPTLVGDGSSGRIVGFRSEHPIWLRPLFQLLPLSLQKLSLRACHLKDEETPSEIGELSDLRELVLDRNEFTRLGFSLSKLTRLKLLNLRGCDQLVELPELPSSLAILEANWCRKLKAIGDCHKRCKWLCQVSLSERTTINDGNKFLESMLQGGNVVENQNIYLDLGGFEIAKGFGPTFVIGSKYTLQLTEDWCNEFSGFLICFALDRYYLYPDINMERVMSGMESEDGEAWEEGDSCECHTLVWYVSFASLRHTKWWDETCNNPVSFSGHMETFGTERVAKSGFGVRLVALKSGNGPTTHEESEFSHYTPGLHILHDSANALRIRLAESVFFS